MQEEEINGLIRDESFLNYCFDRNEQDASYWKQWLKEHPGDSDKIAELKNIALLMGNQAAQEELKEQTSLLAERIARTVQPARVVWFRDFRRVAAVAASVLLLLTAGGYWLLHRRPTQQIAQNKQNDIAPGRNQATLTLANGQTIILNKGLTGKLAQQGNTLVQVNAGNDITYTPGHAEKQVEYNTLTTKRGEESPYPLVLADGTKVWLNAASSIRFPTAFNGKTREVTITGEAYVEVAHNAAKPFRLITRGQTIEDIGTHFDVNAYEDEPAIKTTLLEGSVKVIMANSPTKGVILQPGQQSLVDNSTLKVRDADVDQVVAWRNGKFLFDDEPLAGIMRQVSRWYNVDVSYEDAGLKTKRFGGVTARFASVSELLNTLEMTGKVKFTIQGRNIIVQDK